MYTFKGNGGFVMNMKSGKNNHKEGLSDLEFHKLQLLCKFSKILHKIENDIEEDAKRAGDTQFQKLLEEIEEHLEGYVETLHSMVCGKNK